MEFEGTANEIFFFSYFSSSLFFFSNELYNGLEVKYKLKSRVSPTLGAYNL